jgi:succinate dehydrogenase/fumarate reductase cytochrome b subunit
MWAAVAMLLFSVLISIIILIGKDENCFAKRQNIFKFTKWLFYFQAVLGFALFLISPMVDFGEGFMKDETRRFYGMEHPVMMLIVVGLLAVGLFRAKRKASPLHSIRSIFIYYTLALVVVGMMVPWKAVLS